MKKLHICMLSDQLLANYLPIKQYQPDAVFLIESEEMKKKGVGKRFCSLIEKYIEKEIQVKFFDKLCPNDDYAALHNYFENIANELKELDVEEIVFNLTGGTKLMALAGYNILKNVCHKAIYVNTAKDEILLLPTKEEPEKPIEILPHLLIIPEYLYAYGVKVISANSDSYEWIKKAEERSCMTQKIVDNFVQNPYFNCINRLASKQWIISNEELKMNPKELKIVNAMAQAGFFSIKENFNGNKKQQRLMLNNKFPEEYLKGGWLEEYIYSLLISMDLSVMCGVKIESERELSINIKENKKLVLEENVKNELDVVAIYNNRLLVVECKSGLHKGEDIYKTDSVGERLRGLYGSKWLISLQELKTMEKKRAKEFKLEVFSGKDLSLKKLNEALHRWKGKK